MKWLKNMKETKVIHTRGRVTKISGSNSLNLVDNLILLALQADLSL